MHKTKNGLVVRKNGSPKKLRRFFKKIIIFAAVVYCIITFAVQQVSINRANNVIEEYNEKILVETDVNTRLKNELKQIDTDEYLIQKTREKLGLVRSNERVFVDSSNGGSN